MRFLRYPGGKGRQISFLIDYLPKSKDIGGRYIEPFIGGGSIFFHIRPKNAIISDLNEELIILYKGIKLYPHKVWEVFESFPSGKTAYYTIRNSVIKSKPIYFKAARILYLNRTCFKGMWRHNTDGKFNVGYGGEERRWVITHQNLIDLSKSLKRAEIYCDDFENVLTKAKSGDFVFLDPPYKPGEKDLNEFHYHNGKFLFKDQKRLAETISSISKSKQIKWAMTNSSNCEVLRLYKKFNIRRMPIGTGTKPGVLTNDSQEVLITNY